MAIDTSTFLRSVGLWLALTAAGSGLVFFGMSHAADLLPNDVEAPVSASDARGSQSQGAAAGQAAGGGALNLPAPDFVLSTLEGQQLGPTSFAGDVVVVELWATWCGPCRLQAQYLDQLHREYEGKGVHFLAVNSGENETTVRAFVQKTPFPYPVLLDPRQSVQSRYRADGIPTVMVIDRAGQISFFRVGVVDVPTLRREIEKARGAGGQSV